MKDKNRRLELFSAYDHTGIEAHLENMASKGWMLEKISQFGWVYRRMEPRKLHFAVTYHPRADDYEPEPSEAQKTFNDFCEHSGWILVASFKKMQIFYNERENPVPIETDPVLQVDTIHKAMKKSLLPDCCIILLSCFILAKPFYKEAIGKHIDTLFSTPDFFFTFSIIIIMIAISSLVDAIGYIIWYNRARNAARQGEFLPTSGHRYIKYASLVLIIISFIYYIASVILSSGIFMSINIINSILIIAITMYMLSGIKSGLKSMKVKASTNKAVTSIVSIVVAVLLEIFLVIGFMFAMFADAISNM